jgi:ligand-binding SRPBCC domain-containing protein
MKVYELKRKQILAFSIDLAKMTPPSMGFQILTPSPLEMKACSLIDYTIKVKGLPVRWTTLITEYDPPHKFVDVQLKGPYSFWHHTHELKAVEGGTQMIDRVRYAMPMGWLGRIANTLFVAKQLREIFDYRSRVLQDLLIDSHAE